MGDSQKSPFRWSVITEKIFNKEIALAVLNDPRSSGEDNVFFGFPFNAIRDTVIKEGLADFSVGYEDKKYGVLSAEQKVLCYCFINMKKHWFASYAHFEMEKPTLDKLLAADEPLVLIDVGCGPATAGLAFAEVFPKQKLAYYGVDRALPMQKQARKLMQIGKSLGLVHRHSKITFDSSCDGLKSPLLEYNNLKATAILNFSYFFGNPLLDGSTIRSLVNFTKWLGSRFNRVVLSYTNSAAPIANEKYGDFLTQLGTNLERPPLEAARVDYYLKRSSDVKRSERYVRAFFELNKS